MRIRQFEKRDTDVVIQLANDHAFFDGPISETDLEITFSFPEGFLVAEEDNKIVGIVYGYFKDVPNEVLESWGVSKVSTIELLVVDPQFRKSGIGLTLLENLIEIFEQADIELITLTCPAKAKEARRLYEKLGFEVNAYHMRRRVDKSS